MSAIKNLIDGALRRAGMSQADLARRLGTEPQNVHNWKVRDSIPKAYVTKLSKILGISEKILLDPKSASNAKPSRLAAVDWDSQDELDSEEFFFAPMLEVELSAGGGMVAEAETEAYRLPIRRYTLQKQGISPEDVRMVRVYGDSMADRLPDDSVVAIDTSDTLPRDGKIYAFSDDGLLLVKYLHPLPGGGLRVRSHNPEYPDQNLTPEQVADRITIHGRVFIVSSIL